MSGAAGSSKDTKNKGVLVCRAKSKESASTAKPTLTYKISPYQVSQNAAAAGLAVFNMAPKEMTGIEK